MNFPGVAEHEVIWFLRHLPDVDFGEENAPKLEIPFGAYAETLYVSPDTIRYAMAKGWVVNRVHHHVGGFDMYSLCTTPYGRKYAYSRRLSPTAQEAIK